MKVRFAATVSLAVLCVAGSAAAQSVKSIRVMGDDIRVPVPAGWCEPHDQYVDNAQRAAASDPDNVTFLTLFKCAEMEGGGDLQHLIYIKGPRNALAVRATLPELLKAMGDIPPSDLTAALASDKLDTTAGKNLSQVMGTTVDVQTDIKPAATDASGWYLAGVVRYSAADKNMGLAVAVGMTAVKGHILSYNYYTPGIDLATVRAALTEAQTSTKGFVAANN
jgi:hypothetical protein